MTAPREHYGAGNRVSRRSIVRGGALGGIGLAGAALIGCGDDDEAGTATPGGTTAPGGTAPSGTQAPEETPAGSAQGGVLKVGMASDLTSLEPHVNILAHNDSINHVWDYLTVYDANLEPEARILESWEINEDYTEFVLHVRPDVKWHLATGGTNGQGTITAEDIVINIDRARDPNTEFGQMAPYAREYDEVEAADEMTVVLRASEPRTRVFDFFEQFRIGEPTDIGNAETAYGSNAFQLGEWRPGESFNMLRFPDHYNPNWGLLDEITWAVSIEPQALVAQFDSGALDLIPRPAVRDFVRWRDEGTAQAIIPPSTGAYYAVGYNTSWAPFDDARVRQAMTYAFDKTFFTDTILQGTVGAPYSLPWPEASLAYEADKVDYYTYDPEKARQLLDAAGVGEFAPEIWQTPENPEIREMSEAWQADLADLGVGISATVRQVEVALFVETINSRPPAYPGIWFANSSRANMGSPLTMLKSAVLWNHNADPNTGYGMNNTGFHSQEYFDLLEALHVAIDVEEQRRMYSQVNDIILEENFISFVAPKPPRVAAANKVKNINWWPATDAFHLFETYLEA